MKHLFQQHLVARGNKTPDDNGVCHMQAAVLLSGSDYLLTRPVIETSSVFWLLGNHTAVTMATSIQGQFLNKKAPNF